MQKSQRKNSSQNFGMDYRIYLEYSNSLFLILFCLNIFISQFLYDMEYIYTYNYNL